MDERITYFVDVILPVPIDNTFTYRIPFELNEAVIKGGRVVVPFGRSKLQTGIVIRIHQDAPKAYQVKYIEVVLDDAPIINGKQYKLWQWIASYYMAPLGDVMNAALPSNFKLGSETKIILNPDFDGNEEKLTDREYQVFEAVEIQKELDLKEISEILGIKTIQPVIKSLIEKKVVVNKEEIKQKYKPKTSLFVNFSDEYKVEEQKKALIEALSEDGRLKKQLDLILILLQMQTQEKENDGFVERRKLVKKGVSVSSLNTLVKDHVLITQKRTISRLKSKVEFIDKFKDLSMEQKEAVKSIKQSFLQHRVVLLHGVTGSGKTEVYMDLIREQLRQEKQVLYLLPEIALTTQLIQRLQKYFGDKVGVYHSRFSANERIEIWNDLLQRKSSKYQIIVGARSSVFLPFRNLGLVIVDEEHESSFKQYNPSPRYNGRDIGVVLGEFHKAKVLLGSATPAMETYYNAKEGKYGLVELNQRYGNIRLPEIFTANVREEKRNKSMQSMFSSFLLDKMKTSLKNGEQIILFQNRRGYNPIWMCEVCGWTPQCKNCDVSLTYHKRENILKCHYCGYYSPPVGKCGDCGSNRVKMVGYGTEKIEDELSIILPGTKVQRLDLDTTRHKNSYERIISGFESKEIDILVGTQMVTKGLDFDNVGLVGVLDADKMLHRPDFRAFERSFQLMTQVAGRAGRKNKRGEVVIQTHNPDHWVLRYVFEHDYKSWYKTEIVERKNYMYPPFYKMTEITLKHKDPNKLEVAAHNLADQLIAVFGSRILGPDTPSISKIYNQYLKVIRLKTEREASNSKVKKLLKQQIDKFYEQPYHKAVRVVIDVDPL